MCVCLRKSGTIFESPNHFSLRLRGLPPVGTNGKWAEERDAGGRVVKRATVVDPLFTGRLWFGSDSKPINGGEESRDGIAD